MKPAAAQRARFARGFTLIELLAVILILSIVTTVVLSALGSVSATDSIDSASKRWVEVDRAARLAAVTEGKVSLVIRSNAVSCQREHYSPKPRLEWAFNDVSVQLEIDGKAVNEVTFDRRGVCPDYMVSLEQAGRLRVSRVAGDTGLIMESRR